MQYGGNETFICDLFQYIDKSYIKIHLMYKI